MKILITTEISEISEKYLKFFYNRPHNQPFWFPQKEPINTWLSNCLLPGKSSYEFKNPVQVEVPLLIDEGADFYHISNINLIQFKKFTDRLYRNWLRGQFMDGIYNGITRDLAVFEIMEKLEVIPEDMQQEISQVDVSDPDAVRFIKDLVLDNDDTRKFYERVCRDHTRYVNKKIYNRRYHQKKSKKVNS